MKKYLLLLSLFLFSISSFSQICTMSANNGQTITTCKASIESSGYTSGCGGGGYCNNENYQVTFYSGSPGTPIAINFIGFTDGISNYWFDSESGYDYLYIYNNATGTGAPIATLNGSYYSGYLNYTCNSGYITLKWHSDVSGNAFYGFQAIIGCQPTNCNGNIPANDVCASATQICDLNGYCGNTSGWYTADNPSLAGGALSCVGSIENNSWISFVANSTTATFNVVSGNCLVASSGIQAGILASTNCSSFTLKSNCVAQSTAPGAFTLTATGLTVGTKYYLMVDGFAGNICDYTVTATSGVLTINITATSSSICSGQSTVLTANASGATGYSWAPGGGNSQSITVSPTTTTTYTCTITGACGASKDAVGTVTVSSAIVASIPSPTNVSCYSGNNGSATVSASGGTPGYNYSWSPSGGNAATANSLTAGNYSVTVTDAGGCIKTATVAITQPSALTTVPSQTNLNCNGVCIGSATVTPGGGSSPFTYAWTPSGGNASSASSLCAGNYTVTVTDNKGCAKTQAYTISQPAVLTTVPSQTNLNCNGICIGSASITPGGGSSPFTYAWTPSGGNASSASSLCAGNYTVTVTDNKGCAKTQAYTISQPASAVSVSTSSTNTGCTVANGTATANPSGGTSGYTYSWSPGGQITQTATGLAAGTYSILVTDANGCAKTNTVIVTATGAPTISSTTFTPSGCSVSNGTATVNPSGGTPNYTYSWSPGGQITQTATGLAGGIYTIQVTDANGCMVNTIVNVGSTSSPTISSTPSTSAGCSVSNGTATANPSGGTPGYTYSWSPGGQNTQTATGLAGGTYTILVTDANGCTVKTTVNVGSTSAPIISSTSSTLAGCSAINGTATATISNGTPNYTYLWLPGGQNTQTATGLAGGTYTVLVTDASGCTVNTTVIVGSTSAPSTTASSTQATCATANGTATSNPSGGTPNYSYTWSPGGQNTQTATGLSPGAYAVLVTDASGCTASETITITTANGPTVTTTVANNVSCNGGNDANATANPTGGTPGYTFFWSPGGQNTQTATGLSAGTYTIVTTDTNGCSYVNTTSITQPAVLASTITPSNIPCNGGIGSATATPSGGTPNYTYSWSPTGGNAQTANNLSAGNYVVTVTDANGCISTSSVTITQPAVLASTTSQTNVTCNGGTGSATATPSGGTPNYTYSWSPTGGNAQTANNLSAGTYVVTVTDANGCTALSSVTLTQPSALIAASTQVNVLCNAGSTGSATVSPSGGTPNYTYAWSPSGGNAQTANNLSAGTYQCTVTDANGCSNVISVTINQPQALTAPTTAVNILCNGGSNGSATATPSGGTPGYTYSWIPSGGNAQTANNLSAGNYIVTVTDANGCSKQSPVTITEPAPITLSVSGKDSICQGGNTLLTANVIGGTPAYTYVWNPVPQNGSSVVVSPTSSTSYSVAITDANGCVSLTQTFNVLVLPAPNALFDTASSGTYGSSYSFSDLSTPTVSITAWSWNFGDGDTSTQQNPVHTFPGAGTYTITEMVFNQAGCRDTFRVIITIGEGILIPNVFTPDGDGVNDVWYIPNSGMKEFHVTIFDRWGAKVFETTADEIRWDGHSTSGNLLSDGTYYYVLKAILKSSGGEKDYSTTGYVTLLTKKQ